MSNYYVLYSIKPIRSKKNEVVHVATNLQIYEEEAKRWYTGLAEVLNSTEIFSYKLCPPFVIDLSEQIKGIAPVQFKEQRRYFLDIERIIARELKRGNKIVLVQTFYGQKMEDEIYRLKTISPSDDDFLSDSVTDNCIYLFRDKKRN